VIVALVKTFRPHQWLKNLFVAAPLVFARRLTDGHAVALAVAAVAAFCALSSAVYTLNDVVDVEKDRAHPTKRRRPIAAGVISRNFALGCAAVLALGALAGAAWIRPSFAAVAVGYLAMNVLYSFHVKDIAFLDVGTIATGFFLRVLGGSFAIDVVPSAWLLACTGLLAAFLGFGKRAHELGMIGEDGGGATRKVLTQYRLSHLMTALYLLAVATGVTYVLYTRAAHTILFFGTEKMIYTAPFCLVGIARFVVLVKRHARGDSPTEEMLRDPLFMANLGAWGLAVLGIIYYR
jgi:4-hydroxybenzoate polyprenyltransferase